MPFRTAAIAREGRASAVSHFCRFRAFTRRHPCARLLALSTALFICGARNTAIAAGSDLDAGNFRKGDQPDGGTYVKAPSGAETIRATDADAGAGFESSSSDASTDGTAEAIRARGRVGDVVPVAEKGVAASQTAGDSDGSGSRATKDSNQSIVAVHRTSVDAPREDLTAAASVLTPSDGRRAIEDLGSLLLEVPGTNITRRGGFGSFATISLRGANPDEVRIFIDGIPLNQAVGGAVDLSTLPLGDVERVEVYRGSSPIVFGESALGGVVSISTRTPGISHASARAGAGSFRTAFADGTAGGSIGRLKLYAGLHTLRAVGNFPYAAAPIAGGYQADTRENNDLAQLDGVFRATLSLPGRRELRTGFIGIGRDQGLPAEEIYRAVAARARTARLLAHLDYESRDDLGSSSRLRTALFASGVWDTFSDPLHEIEGVPTVTHDLSRSLGTTTTAEKAFGDWARVTGLVEGRLEQYLPRNDADPVTPVGYPAARRAGTVGVELDAHSARMNLDILPSARLEASNDVRTGRDLLFGTHLPPGPPINRVLPILRVGLLHPLGMGTSLRANIGRYGRIPTFVELYGYNRGLIGNPDLRPERGVNADVGVSVNREGPAGVLLASVTLFGAEVEDLIAWQTFSTQTRAQNISRARVLGIETEMRVRSSRLTVVGQATLTDARDQSEVATSADQQLAHHPRNRGYGRAEWRQPIGATRFTTVGYVDLEASSGNFWTTSVYGALPPRILVGAGVALLRSPTGLRLSASAINLGDSRVHDFPGYPQPGRSLFVALGWSSARSDSTVE